MGSRDVVWGRGVELKEGRVGDGDGFRGRIRVIHLYNV